jgi:alpha-aminoadipate carrier protein LysW
MPKTYCPACDGVIIVENPRDGATIKCPECGEELEIISTDPFEVDFPLDVEESWDEEWEED